MSAYLDAAIFYATVLGFPLFPAHPQTKRPLIKTGRDHAEHASRDPAQLAEWFEDADCAIAMPTGVASGVVAIDADAKHNGEHVLAQLEARYGELPRKHVVRTQSGGIHVYTRHPGAGVRIKSCVGHDSTPWTEHGVDVRGDGGIVLLPPSNGYAWEIDEGDGFEPLPVGWLSVLRADAKPKREPIELPPIVVTGVLDDPHMNEYRDQLARQATNYRRRKKSGDDVRAELLDRIVTGRALAQPGERDSSVTRAGYMVGLFLPTIGADVAERLAYSSLSLIPSDDEDTEHWIAKYRDSYDAGSHEAHDHRERSRLFAARMARAFGGAK